MNSSGLLAHESWAASSPLYNNGGVPDPCADCGFLYDLSQSAAIERSIRERSPRSWQSCAPATSTCDPGGSPVCVVAAGMLPLRDMLLVQRERVHAARRMDQPDCAPSGRDERVVQDDIGDWLGATVRSARLG